MKLQEEFNEGRLFHRWCRENDQHVRKFKFYKRISKEIHEDVEVPDWNKADLSLLCKFGGYVENRNYYLGNMFSNTLKERYLHFLLR